MKNFKRYGTFLFLVIVVSTGAVRADASLPQAIDRHLAALKGVTSNYGIMILSADDREIIYKNNHNLPLIPASNQKIVTTVAALATLGADFEFTTTLATDGDNLIVIGDGDPATGDPRLAGSNPITELFDRWALALKTADINTIPGKLIIDASIFDQQYTHPRWSIYQDNVSYAAPVGGLNFNNNCLSLSVRYTPERTPQLIVLPQCPAYTIEPEIRNDPKSETTIWPVWETPDTLKIRIRLGPQNAGPASFAVNNPVEFFAEVCRDHLSHHGLPIEGPTVYRKIRRPDGTLPDTLRVIARNQTPIMSVVDRTNRNSQNMFAEALFKRIGGSQGNGIGTWSDGRSAIEAFLQNQLNLSTENIVIDDGSGLSRNNRISAELLARLLLYAEDQPWSNDFRKSLAVAGVSGTLSRRMARTPAAGKIYGKTGYIGGVSSLSGYVLDDQKNVRYVFAMLFNNIPSGKLSQIQDVQHKICIDLAKNLTTQPSEPKGEQ